MLLDSCGSDQDWCSNTYRDHTTKDKSHYLSNHSGHTAGSNYDLNQLLLLSGLKKERLYRSLSSCWGKLPLYSFTADSKTTFNFDKGVKDDSISLDKVMCSHLAVSNRMPQSPWFLLLINMRQLSESCELSRCDSHF